MSGALAFREIQIATPKGPRTALHVAPTTEICLGLERLAELRASQKSRGAIDLELVDQVRRRRGRLQVLLFSAQGDGAARWHFDERLTDDEAEELGYLLTRSQLPTWRRLAVAGVYAHVHADWGVRETACSRRGATRVREELERDVARAAGRNQSVDRFDAWLLSYLSLFFSADVDRVIREILPDKLGLLERKLAKMEELVRALPADAIA